MEGYKEHMVKKRTTGKDRAVRILFWVLIALSAAGAVLLLQPIFFLVTVSLYMVYRYLVYPLTDLEYEYLYCDKQLTVSKIMAKERRKDLEVLDLDKVEILAPANSYRLAEYKNREFKISQYWSLEEETVPYVMVYEGGRKILLDLADDFVKIIQNNAPRKVFLD